MTAPSNVKLKIYAAIILFVLVVGIIAFSGAEALISASYSVKITQDGAAKNEIAVTATMMNLPFGTVLESRPPDGAYDDAITITGVPAGLQYLGDGKWEATGTTDRALAFEYKARASHANPMTQGTYATYMGGDCGLLYGGSFLVKPQVNEGTAEITFELPDGWVVIPDETWQVAGQNKYTAKFSDINALVAVGKYETARGTFGKNNDKRLLVGVCGKQAISTQEFLNGIKATADYLDKNFLELPQEELHAIITELPLPQDYMSQTPRLAVQRAPRDWGFIEGMLWHYWGPPASYASQDEADAAWWIFEGISPFYLYPVYEEIGAADAVGRAQMAGWGWKTAELSWKNWCGIYESYLGTKYDLPLTEYPKKSKETGDLKYYVPLPYMKSALVLFLLDSALQEYTHGQIDVRKLGSRVFTEYGAKGIGVTNAHLLESANSMSGNDFSDFFGAYVYGNERLPVIAGKNGDYSVDWTKLGDKAYEMKPNSEGAHPYNAVASMEPLPMKKEGKHFTVYFNPEDAGNATLLLLDCERAYGGVTRVFGKEGRLRIKMFVTYNGTEYAYLGGNPSRAGEYESPDVSAGGVAVEAGDEIEWLRPIKEGTSIRPDVCVHELGHALLRQTYYGTYSHYEQWFSEAGYLPKRVWLDGNYSEAEFPPPFQDRQYYEAAKTSLLSGEHPSFAELAKEDFGTSSESQRALFSVGGDLFYFYLEARYDNGVQRFLTEYDKNVTLRSAVENAFGVPFGTFETDLWATAKKAAENAGTWQGALEGVRLRGVRTEAANKLASQEPMYGLFYAYASAERAGLDINSISIVAPTNTQASPVPSSIIEWVREGGLEYGPVGITPAELHEWQNISVSIRVWNPGTVSVSAEVPFSAGGADYGKKKISVNAGETVTVVFDNFTLGMGEYDLAVGPRSERFSVYGGFPWLFILAALVVLFLVARAVLMLVLRILQRGQ